MKQRVLSLLLALALCLALAVPALAAQSDETTADTVELLDANGGLAGTHGLADALRAVRDGYTVKLLEDITVTGGSLPGRPNKLFLGENADYTLDLNGHTITGNVVCLPGPGDITLTGGTIRGVNASRLDALAIGDVSVTLKEMTVTAAADQNSAVSTGGLLTIVSGTYTGIEDALVCMGGSVTLVSGTFVATGDNGDGCIVKNTSGTVALAEGSTATPADDWLGDWLGAFIGASRVVVAARQLEGSDSGQSGTGAITFWKNPGFVKPKAEPAYTGGESVMQAGGKATVEQAAPWLLLEARASGAALLEELVLTVGEDYHLYVSDTGGTVFALTASGRAKLKEAGAETLTLEFANCTTECKL